MKDYRRFSSATQRSLLRLCTFICAFFIALTTLQGLIISNVFGEDSLIQWDPLPRASSYRVSIFKDPALKNIINRLDLSTENQSYLAKGLEPGTYYVLIEGIGSGGEIISAQAPKALVVGPTMQFTASPFALPPPRLIAPALGATLAPQTKIRFVWSQNRENARYRFKLMKKNEKTGDAILLWQTDTDQTALEIYDAPPSSYRFFKTGHYEWHVSSLSGPDKTKPIEGPEAISAFEVSPRVFIEKPEEAVYLSPNLEFGFFQYQGTSGVTLNKPQINGRALRLSTDLHLWTGLESGLLITGSLTNMDSASIKGVLKALGALGIWRFHWNQLWSFEAALGAGVRQELQVDDDSTKSFPISFGPQWRFRLKKRWSSRWQSHIQWSGLVPLATYRGGGNGDEIQSTQIRPLNSEIAMIMTRTLAPSVDLNFGVRGFWFESGYQQVLGTTENSLRGILGFLGFNFSF